MPRSTHVLTDLASETWLETFRLDESQGPRLSGSSKWSVSKRVLRGGPAQGVDVVRVDNGILSFELLPTRGMGLWRGNFQDLQLGWQSPVQFPVHPGLVRLTADDGLGWLTGFNEWMCRCGLNSIGRPGVDALEQKKNISGNKRLTLHGRISNIPAHRVEVVIDDDGPGNLVVRGEVDEAMLFGPTLRLSASIRTQAGANCLHLQDEITNFGNHPNELQILYHTNFGNPLLEQGAKIITAAKLIAPCNQESAATIDQWATFLGPSPGFIEQGYFLEPLADEEGNGVALLHNAAANQGIRLTYNAEQLPCFTLWKNTAGDKDGYVTGLEPGTSYPNLKSFERQQGRVVVLQPGETYRTGITISVLNSSTEVKEVSESIRRIQDTTPIRFHRQPHRTFSPAQN